jgi:hypothetical protein
MYDISPPPPPNKIPPPPSPAAAAVQHASGTQFTCVTNTKVQILTPEELLPVQPQQQFNMQQPMQPQQQFLAGMQTPPGMQTTGIHA